MGFDDFGRSEQQSQARTDIVVGLLLLIVGIAITSATYSSASQQGGTYIVAYGPIIFGVIRLFRGLFRLGG
jgi:uncharacterized membrane protein